MLYKNRMAFQSFSVYGLNLFFRLQNRMPIRMKQEVCINTWFICN